MEDWTCLGQHKRQPEFPVVTRESRRNSRKTTGLPRHRKMKPFPATAPQEKSQLLVSILFGRMRLHPPKRTFKNKQGFSPRIGNFSELLRIGYIVILLKPL